MSEPIVAAYGCRTIHGADDKIAVHAGDLVNDAANVKDTLTIDLTYQNRGVRWWDSRGRG